MMRIFCFFCFCFALSGSPCAARAETPLERTCAASDRLCLLDMVESVAGTIPESRWRDQILRDLARSFAKEGLPARALALIDRIESPDTRAMTIRAIGFAIAHQEDHGAVFVALRDKADALAHPPSHAIALTYIAMAQALAGDDSGALRTALDMENAALRDKALGENAGIQAARGDVAALRESLARIEDPAFQDKARRICARVLAQTGYPDSALDVITDIVSPFLRAETVQFLLDQAALDEGKEDSP